MEKKIQEQSQTLAIPFLPLFLNIADLKERMYYLNQFKAFNQLTH